MTRRVERAVHRVLGRVLDRVAGRSPAPSGARGSEDGSTLVLIIFYGVFALALVLVVVAATSLSLERNRLYSLADGAALAGAEAFTLGAVQAGPTGLTANLSDAGVHGAVQGYLELVPQGSLDGVAVVRAGSPDGRSAEVTLSAQWRPPVLTLVLPSGIRLEATATARSVLR